MQRVCPPGKMGRAISQSTDTAFPLPPTGAQRIGPAAACQPAPVFCHGIVAVAYAGVNRVLKHVIPILYQKVAKSSGFPPLLFCLDGQVKKYKHSHKSTHNRGAAMPAASAAPKRRPFPCRCAGFAPAVPWRKPRCGAVRRKECQRSSARTARA